MGDGFLTFGDNMPSPGDGKPKDPMQSLSDKLQGDGMSPKRTNPKDPIQELLDQHEAEAMSPKGSRKSPFDGLPRLDCKDCGHEPHEFQKAPNGPSKSAEEMLQEFMDRQNTR